MYLTPRRGADTTRTHTRDGLVNVCRRRSSVLHSRWESSPTRRSTTSSANAAPILAASHRSTMMEQTTLTGAWSTPRLSGGCPQHATWRSNPQFTLEPSATASYELSLRQPPARNMPAIGLVVLHGTAPSVAAEAGPLQAAALVGKSAWKASPVQALTVQLEAGCCYVVVRRHGQSSLTRSSHAAAHRPTAPPPHRPTRLLRLTLWPREESARRLDAQEWPRRRFGAFPRSVTSYHRL